MTRRLAHQRGMALLEVGVALLVLSISMLAVAMVLASTARSQRSGNAMIRAAMLANDISEQMRANRSAVEAAAPNRGFVLAGAYAALSQSSALTTPTCGGRYVSPPPSSTNTVLPACNTAKGFADYATASWLAQVQTTLPSGAGSIIDDGGARRRIALAWMEPVTDRVSGTPTPLNDPNCPAALTVPAGVRCLVLEFSL